ncbi:hypothetical protein ACIREG_09900 [Streptomyces albidoflavus]|nr:hypothetical protein GA0115236_150117 [Streptomyces sp. IgraMP-1]
MDSLIHQPHDFPYEFLVVDGCSDEPTMLRAIALCDQLPKCASAAGSTAGTTRRTRASMPQA